MKEMTFEITNYCPHRCKYCSSETTTSFGNAMWIPYSNIEKFLRGKKYDRIILSGGEPLAHPQFWNILQRCKEHADDVVIYTNAIQHLVHNANVLPEVYLEVNLNVLPNVKEIHVLKRVQQGREATRPEVHFSGNFTGECFGCDSKVMRPDGAITPSPCRKDVINENKAEDGKSLDEIYYEKNYLDSKEDRIDETEDEG